MGTMISDETQFGRRTEVAFAIVQLDIVGVPWIPLSVLSVDVGEGRVSFGYPTLRKEPMGHPSIFGDRVQKRIHSTLTCDGK
jgi:hypothetical protein